RKVGSRKRAVKAISTAATYPLRSRSTRSTSFRRHLMDGLSVSNLKGISAPVNFTAPMDEKPYSYNYDPGPGIALRNTENEERRVTVYDGRGLDLSLDREGFALVHHQTAAADLYDEEIIKSVYYPECEKLMREATGAKNVIAFDHIVRNAAKSGPGSLVKLPA